MQKPLAAFIAALSFAAFAPEGDARELMGVAIAKSDDHVYYWYSDNGGQVASGLTNDPFRYRGPQPFAALDGWALMGIGINSQDRVYYWWLSNATGQMMVTVGTSQNPVAHQTTIGVWQPNGYILQDAAIAADDRVYYYWRDRTTHQVFNSVGTSVNPVAYRDLRPVEGAIFMMSHALMHVGIASDDHVYYFWRRMADDEWFVTAGTSTDPFAYRNAYPANQPD